MSTSEISAELLAEYNDLVDAIQLRSVALHSCEMQVGETDEPTTLLKPPGYRHQRTEDDAVYCGVKLEVVVVEESGVGLSIVAEYALFYGTESEPSDEALELFASRNAIFNAWPFFRELANSLASRSGLGGFVLPLLSLPPEPFGEWPLDSAETE